MQLDEATVYITFLAVASKILLGWLVGMENTEVIEPEYVRNNMIELINRNINRY